MQPTLIIEPGPREILRLARERFARLDERGKRLREQLGLPTDRPVIMSGHQLAVWHPGILAKWLFVSAAAQAERGAWGGWVWVDQDANRYADLAFPLRTESGVLKMGVWRAAAGGWGQGISPVCGEPPFEVAGLPRLKGAAYAAASVGPGIERARGALARAREGAGSAADQIERAVVELLGPLESPVGRCLRATALARTDLFAECVERMRERPRECTDAYNAAVAAYPDGHGAEVSMLSTGVGEGSEGGAELPLWWIRRRGATGVARVRVHAADLAKAPVEELAPRGLMMTALLRLGACDVFIHGTGGGGPAGYDRITDLWMKKWMGVTLAPTAVVTATLRLDLGEPENPPTEAEARRARWLAHHARHHPSLIGDGEAAARKRELLEEIRRAERGSARREALFREMHAVLERARAGHAERLAELERAAEVAEARLGNAAVARERTWPFVLYPEGDLVRLREMVRGAVG